MGPRFKIRVYQKAGSHMEVDTFTAIDVHHMRRLVDRAWAGGATAVDVESAKERSRTVYVTRAQEARATAKRLSAVGHRGAASQWLRYAEMLEEVASHVG